MDLSHETHTLWNKDLPDVYPGSEFVSKRTVVSISEKRTGKFRELLLERQYLFPGNASRDLFVFYLFQDLNIHQNTKMVIATEATLDFM